MRITAIERQVRYSNLSQQEWRAKRSLVDNRNIVIKKSDKNSCVGMRITAIERQVRDSNLFHEEWKAIRSLVDDWNIVIK